MIAPCVIPNGKYVLTLQWRLLSAQETFLFSPIGVYDIPYAFDSLALLNTLRFQEHAALQGVSPYDFLKYQMHKKDPRIIKKMAGDASLIFFNLWNVMYIDGFTLLCFLWIAIPKVVW